MNGNPQNKPIYTVMADCGVGEFLWVKRTGDMHQGVGPLAMCLMYIWSDQDLMSRDLFEDFTKWARRYMRGQPADWSLPWNIEWDDFNREGEALAIRLQAELGDRACVQYRRAWNDPHRKG